MPPYAYSYTSPDEADADARLMDADHFLIPVLFGACRRDRLGARFGPRQGKAWLGGARLGRARLGMARQGRAGRGRARGRGGFRESGSRLFHPLFRVLVSYDELDLAAALGFPASRENLIGPMQLELGAKGA
jgi:hypothetical protein